MKESWTDSLAHRTPSNDRVVYIARLSQEPFQPSTSMQKDLQQGLTEVLDLLTLITAENIKLMRMGNLDQDACTMLSSRANLLAALERTMGARR